MSLENRSIYWKASNQEATKDKSYEKTRKKLGKVLDIVFEDLAQVFKNDKFQENAAQIRMIILSLLDKNKRHFEILFDSRHDFSTILHSVSVMVLSVHVYLHIEENIPLYLFIGSLEDFVLGALLHDMGKVYLLDIVRKAGAPNEEELERLKKHPEDGVEFLEDLGFGLSTNVLNVTKYHHRRANGTGYPEIAEGEYVHSLTHLVGILDSIEAMTSRKRIHNTDKAQIDFDEAILRIGQEVEAEHKYPPKLFNLVANSLAD